ncbi:SCO family protein [Xanthobacter sp. DSM 24535]|nr:SCO family protein [Aquabacter spiritensis]
MIRIALWGLVAVACIAVAGVASGVLPIQKSPPVQTGSDIPDIGGPFRLTTHKGTVLTDADLHGRPFLVFFGFTNCPDICPTTLSELTMHFEKLGRDADKLSTVFITVDPDRDTQDLLSQYMEAFDPRFVALRGSVAETEAIAKAYKAFVRKVPLESGGYTMDHNAIVYLMDRDGRFVSSLDPHESEDVQLAKLRRLIAG